MKVFKLAVLICTIFLSFSCAWSAEYRAKEGEQLIGIDAKKQTEEEQSQKGRLVIYVSPEDLRLAKKLIRECLKFTPKDNPFYPDLLEDMRMLNDKTIAPDVQRVLALSFAEQSR